VGWRRELRTPQASIELFDIKSIFCRVSGGSQVLVVCARCGSVDLEIADQEH
jgi:hypothetical protein